MSEVDSNLIADIYQLLPGKNCGQKSPCGLPKCAMFAKEIIIGAKEIKDCPYLQEENMQSILLRISEAFR